MAVVNANYVKRNENERQTAKGNIYYIQNRPGRERQGQPRTLFGAAGFLGRYEAYQFINTGYVRDTCNFSPQGVLSRKVSFLSQYIATTSGL
jgi:hypothetical protein